MPLTGVQPCCALPLDVRRDTRFSVVAWRDETTIVNGNGVASPHRVLQVWQLDGRRQPYFGICTNESEMKGGKGGKGGGKGGKGGEGKGGSSPNTDSDSSIIAGSNDTDHSFPNTPEASPRQAPGSAIKLTQGMYNAHRNWQHIKHTVRSTAAHHEQVAQL